MVTAGLWRCAVRALTAWTCMHASAWESGLFACPLTHPPQLPNMLSPCCCAWTGKAPDSNMKGQCTHACPAKQALASDIRCGFAIDGHDAQHNSTRQRRPCIYPRAFMLLSFSISPAMLNTPAMPAAALVQESAPGSHPYVGWRLHPERAGGL